MVEEKKAEDTKPMFSIIVPVYNVEPYLRRCIDSLLDQDIQDYEIILIDDGSTDGSPQICDEYGAVHERIRIIHQVNGGLSDARNAGMRIAKGEYILFVDSDDTLEPKVLGKLKKLALETDAQMISGRANRFDPKKGNSIIGVHYKENDWQNSCGHGQKEKRKKEILKDEEFLLYAMRTGGFLAAVWLYVWKRAFLIDNQLCFKYGILAEDQDFTPRALLKAKRVCCSELIHYNYFIRQGSITQAKDQSQLFSDLVDTINRLQLELSQLPEGELKSSFGEYLVKLWIAAASSRGMAGKKRKDILRRFDPQMISCGKKMQLRVKLVKLSPLLYRSLLFVYGKILRMKGI